MRPDREEGRQGPKSCRRQVEISPGAQNRNDTPRRTHLARDGTPALRWVRAVGSTGAAGTRSAAPEAVVLTQHHRKAVRQSVAAIPARRFGRGQFVEAQTDDRLKRLLRRHGLQGLGQCLERGGTGPKFDSATAPRQRRGRGRRSTGRRVRITTVLGISAMLPAFMLRTVVIVDVGDEAGPRRGRKTCVNGQARSGVSPPLSCGSATRGRRRRPPCGSCRRPNWSPGTTASPWSHRCAVAATRSPRCSYPAPRRRN